MVDTVGTAVNRDGLTCYVPSCTMSVRLHALCDKGYSLKR
jgi:hypothetical protein